ncbi:MAG: glutamine--tRNA ligase/YqeY domain fusion protein [Eubacteriaceae bacterium]|jgi:glutaminyl-tRNA synthetase|nr:glutamine--tRNA ligase/YqeY domain fusion protein [Eubacteriaceae bacterium]
MSELDSNFIFSEIDRDIRAGVYDRDKIKTRFPPEPNGYLHIGHAKAVYISFSVKERYGGTANLRFDDTNPSKEDTEYAQAICEDISWLGYQWDELHYASNYFPQMYSYACELIRKGLAYVDSQSPEEIKASRGTLTEKGKESPFRNISPEESLRLFEEMRSGKWEAGSKVLRAKIDMASPNINLRDPVLYRILFAPHHNTGEEWCIYPMYDYAHPIEDAIEKITHSLCSIEFEDHRPFYDWLLANLDDYKENRPRQIEFARLELENALTSKRFIKRLVDEGIVDGWDDPRLYTLQGVRRRGVTPNAIRLFCESTGVAKTKTIMPHAQFDYYVREDLQKMSPRAMAVVDPIRLIIENYPEGETETLEIPNDASDPSKGFRLATFGRELYIEAEDFMAQPVPKYRRLYPGNEVRLMGAYFVACTRFKIESNGSTTVYGTYDPKSKSGSGFSERKPKGTIHWVYQGKAVPILTREFSELYDASLEGSDLIDKINRNSVLERRSYAEESIESAKAGDRFQFVRKGFYCMDAKLSKPGLPVFNLTVSLKSGWKPEGA